MPCRFDASWMLGSETTLGERATNNCTPRRRSMNYVQRAKSFRILQPFVLVTLVLTLIWAAIPASAETPTDIYNFKGGTSDVADPEPYGVMTQGRDGSLYS